MTRQRLRQLLVLGAVLIILALVWVLRPGRGTPAATGAAAVATTRSGEPRDTSVVDVRLELLNRAAGRVSSSDRNPFRFAQRAQPAARRALPPPNVAPVFQGPPPPPPIPLRFIGVIEASQRSGGRVAIFSDGRGAVMHGKEGEIVEGRYRVVRMGLDSVELTYADGRGRQTIRLSGQ